MAQSSGGSEHGSSLCLALGEGLMAEGQVYEDKRGRNETIWHTLAEINSVPKNKSTHPAQSLLRASLPPLDSFRPNVSTRFGGEKQYDNHSTLSLKGTVSVAPSFHQQNSGMGNIRVVQCYN